MHKTLASQEKVLSLLWMTTLGLLMVPNLISPVMDEVGSHALPYSDIKEAFFELIPPTTAYITQTKGTGVISPP